MPVTASDHREAWAVQLRLIRHCLERFRVPGDITRQHALHALRALVAALEAGPLYLGTVRSVAEALLEEHT